MLGIGRTLEHITQGHAVLVYAFQPPNFVIYDPNDNDPNDNDLNNPDKRHQIAMAGGLLPYTNTTGTFVLFYHVDPLGVTDAELDGAFKKIYSQYHPGGATLIIKSRGGDQQ